MSLSKSASKYFLEMGNLTISKALVKTDLLLKDSLAAIETAANNKNIFLEKNVSENTPSLVGDKELLKVAIINRNMTVLGTNRCAGALSELCTAFEFMTFLPNAYVVHWYFAKIIKQYLQRLTINVFRKGSF